MSVRTLIEDVLYALSGGAGAVVASWRASSPTGRAVVLATGLGLAFVVGSGAALRSCNQSRHQLTPEEIELLERFRAGTLADEADELPWWHRTEDASPPNRLSAP